MKRIREASEKGKTYAFEPIKNDEGEVVGRRKIYLVNPREGENGKIIFDVEDENHEIIQGRTQSWEKGKMRYREWQRVKPESDACAELESKLKPDSSNLVRFRWEDGRSSLCRFGRRETSGEKIGDNEEVGFSGGDGENLIWTSTTLNKVVAYRDPSGKWIYAEAAKPLPKPGPKANVAPAEDLVVPEPGVKKVGEELDEPSGEQNVPEVVEQEKKPENFEELCIFLRAKAIDIKLIKTLEGQRNRFLIEVKKSFNESGYEAARGTIVSEMRWLLFVGPWQIEGIEDSQHIIYSVFIKEAMGLIQELKSREPSEPKNEDPKLVEPVPPLPVEVPPNPGEGKIPKDRAAQLKRYGQELEGKEEADVPKISERIEKYINSWDDLKLYLKSHYYLGNKEILSKLHEKSIVNEDVVFAGMEDAVELIRHLAEEEKDLDAANEFKKFLLEEISAQTASKEDDVAVAIGKKIDEFLSKIK